jgi:hypothetical protein
MRYLNKTFCLIFFLLITVGLYAQGDTSRYKLVQSLSRYIRGHYVSAELAKKMSDTICLKFADGGYDSSLNFDEFAYEVTKDLRRVSKDLHILVTKPIYYLRDDDDYSVRLDRMTDKQRRKYYDKARKRYRRFEATYKKKIKEDMYTYGEIKILPGNIGYLEIKNFERSSINRKKNRERIPITSVMEFLKNTNSIIIDLRDNQGGYIKQAARFCSFFSPGVNNYFITAEWHYRYDSSGVEKEMSAAEKIYTDKDISNSFARSKNIYILTSQRTFSAAEMTTYKIKNYKPEAIVIGEKTSGGGNGHSGATTEKNFSAVIPYLKCFDEQNGNYSIEANGIVPDIVVAADSALVMAYQMAVKGSRLTDNKTRYFRKVSVPVIVNEQYFSKKYQDYVGDYRKMQITIEDNKLFIVYDNYEKAQLYPEATDYFNAKGVGYVKFLRDSSGRVSEVELNHANIFKEQFRKL